jgi:hypothetical protein
MNSDALVAVSGLLILGGAALTGALWGTQLVAAPLRWLLR